MPLAKDYVCYSVRRGQAQHGIAAKTLIDIGVRCSVTGVQAERIARFVAKSLRVKLGKVYVKNIGTGWSQKPKFKFMAYGKAKVSESFITLPHWILHKAKPYTVYYIAHEVAHLHQNAHGHESSFKRVERRALKRFGMGIRYMHAYPRELFSLKDGRVLYEASKQRALRMKRGKQAEKLITFPTNGDGQ